MIGFFMKETGRYAAFIAGMRWLLNTENARMSLKYNDKYSVSLLRIEKWRTLGEGDAKK